MQLSVASLDTCTHDAPQKLALHAHQQDPASLLLSTAVPRQPHTSAAWQGLLHDLYASAAMETQHVGIEDLDPDAWLAIGGHLSTQGLAHLSLSSRVRGGPREVAARLQANADGRMGWQLLLQGMFMHMQLWQVPAAPSLLRTRTCSTGPAAFDDCFPALACCSSWWAQ
jgi:hypothetical protein